jgi:hypothetical protein
MVVTNLHRRLDARRWLLERNPVAALDGEVVFLQHRFIAHNHAIVRRVQLHHVKRFAGGNAEPLALADRVEFNSVVMSRHVAVPSTISPRSSARLACCETS